MSTENGKVHSALRQAKIQETAATKVKVISDAGCGNVAHTSASLVIGNTLSNNTRNMNGSTTTPLQKLSSLKPARDLTLGGRGGANATKKVFTPNLNVVRNKNTNVKTCKDTTARGRGRGAKTERGTRGRGGGRGAANSSLIQTTGVFSEGAGAVNIRKTTASGTSSYSRTADDTPSAMRKPTLIKNELKKIDLQANAAHMRELLGDSDEDDFVDEKTDLDKIPIKLNEAKWKPLKSEIKLEKLDAENGTGVSVEDAELANADTESSIVIAQQIQALHVQQQQQQRTNSALPHYPKSVEELLRQSQPQLFLLQLPDSLPCEDDGTDDSPEKSTKMNALNDASSSHSPAANPAPAKGLSLKQMEEGKVGKLLRYKSGKVKLVFGDIYFDLGVGMETGFLQDLMSINTNREERSGNMINLGPIQAKLTATPDWEYLLQQQMSQEHA